MPRILALGLVAALVLVFGIGVAAAQNYGAIAFSPSLVLRGPAPEQPPAAGNGSGYTPYRPTP